MLLSNVNISIHGVFILLDVSNARTCLAINSYFIVWPLMRLAIICFSARIELGGVTGHNIKQLKKLNAVVFPISYTEKVGLMSSCISSVLSDQDLYCRHKYTAKYVP